MTTPATEPGVATLTRFLILKEIEVLVTAADLGQEGQDTTTKALVWLPVGEQLARDRMAALRLFLGTPVREVEDTYTAVSENAWRPQLVSIKPAFKITEAQ